LAERVLGKDEVSSSILDIGSILRARDLASFERRPHGLSTEARTAKVERRRWTGRRLAVH